MSEFLPGDYSDYIAIMRDICGRYPNMIIWGTDSPSYSFIHRREMSPGKFRDYYLKATYMDEVEALRCLDAELQRKVGCENALTFLFGNAEV